MRHALSFALAGLVLALPALAEVPRVMTDTPPVHALVAQVMGDLGTPELLLDRGADAHAFQLRPSQARALAGAGLIVWIGPEMTPWLERTLDGMGTTGAQLRLLSVPGTLTLAYGGDGTHSHGGAGAEAAAERAEADHADGAEQGDAGEEHHDGSDPHAWLDPANAAVWVAAIAAELARLDPENAGTYSANAAATTAELAVLDAEVARILAPVQGRPVVLFHDAYRYFTGHYGVTVAGTVALGDASSPGARRLAALREELEGGIALCIFPEAQHDPGLVAQMAEGTGVTIGGALDPEGSTLEPGAGLYAALLRGLATTLADCLVGS